MKEAAKPCALVVVDMQNIGVECLTVSEFTDKMEG